MITIFVGRHIEKLDSAVGILSNFIGGDKSNTVFMFRPERDLHPALAVDRVAEDRVWQYAEWGRNLIMTTHSSEIINYIGTLVYVKVIPTHQVKIVMMDDANKNVETIADFDDDGILRNWPFGWFQPDMRHFTESPLK